jgi:hypothetical protein
MTLTGGATFVIPFYLGAKVIFNMLCSIVGLDPAEEEKREKIEKELRAREVEFEQKVSLPDVTSQSN